MVVLSKEITDQGMNLENRLVTISEVVSVAEHSNQKDTFYAVDIDGKPGNVVRTVGFLSRADAQRFVTGYGEQEFDVLDANNHRTSVTRECLGVPSGMLASRQNEPVPVAETRSFTVSTTPIVVPEDNQTNDNLNENPVPKTSASGTRHDTQRANDEDATNAASDDSSENDKSNTVNSKPNSKKAK